MKLVQHKMQILYSSLFKIKKFVPRTRMFMVTHALTAVYIILLASATFIILIINVKLQLYLEYV